MIKEFELLDNRTGKKTPFTTKVKLELVNGILTLEYDCKDSKLYSAYEGYNTNIYEGDVVETFLCLDGNLKNYYEIEVAPNNSVFFQKIYNPGTGIDEDIKLYPLENIITSSVEISGNDYRVKLSLPLTEIGYDKGRGIYLNVFRIETEGGIRDKNLLSLSPTFSDTFHDSSAFIKIKE